MGKHNAQVPLEIGEQKFTIFYGWNEIDDLQEKFGEKVLTDLVREAKPKTVIEILMVGLRVHQPNITKEEILKINPPIMGVVNTIDKALFLSYFGGELPEISEQDIAEAKEQTKGKKKTK